MENKDQPAFGGEHYVASENPLVDDNKIKTFGFTKREYVAFRLMNTLVRQGRGMGDSDRLADDAVSKTDALFKRLDQK